MASCRSGSSCFVAWPANILTLSSILVGTAVLLMTTTVLSQQPRSSFDIVPGQLVYFNSDSDTTKTGDPAPIFHSFNNIFLERQPQLGHSDHNERHYNKGNLRRTHFQQREFDNGKNAKRQGQNCPGVCRYIPDRDFCPTFIAADSEASDEGEEEYEEDTGDYSDEYYYDDEKDIEANREQGKDKRNERPRLTEGRRRSNSTSQGKVEGYGQYGDSLHIVYPQLTRFATLHGVRGQEQQGLRDKLRSGKVGNSPGRRRRRQRRPAAQEQPKFRPSALEQEILIRWDREVERGPFIGGDILVPPGVFLRPPNFRFVRKQWADGEIPFTMDPTLNSCRQNIIFDAMDEIEKKTCIRFVDRENDRNYIDIRRAQIGCSSYVGMVGGAQHLNLSTGCFSKFTVTHELMHAIGFDHEQSRKDRDKFIEVDFDNVLNAKAGQFELNPTFTGSGFPYDIRSIMHYSAFLFAKDKCEPTIYPLNDNVDICELGLGNGKGGMTDCDAAKINKMYKCAGRKYPRKCKAKK